MRKNFGPQTWLFPMPALMIGTYDESGNPDVMVAAWGGIQNFNRVAVCIDKGHKTAENFSVNKSFTVSFADMTHLAACDYLGIISANTEPDKLKKSGLSVRKSEFVNAPIINELPVTLECRLIEFDEKNEQAIGEIVNVSADESVLDAQGKISIDKLQPLCFDPVKNEYRVIGAVAGPAFKAGLKFK